MIKIRPDIISKNIDQFLWVWLILLAALMPLLFSTSSNSRFYLKIVVAGWMLFIFYALWAARFFILPSEEFIYGPLLLLFAALIFLAVISTSLSLHRFTALWGEYNRFEGLSTVLLYSSTFFAAAGLRWDKGRLFFLIKLLTVIAGVISLYALAQSAGYDFMSWRVLKFETGRAYANFGNPVMLGSYLVMMLPMPLMLTLLEKQKIMRWLWLAIDIMIIGGLIASMTRGAWLAAVVGYIAITWIALRQKLIPWRRLALISSIFLLSIITIGLLIVGKGKSGNILVDKIISLSQPGAGTIHARTEIWKGAVKVVRSRPFFGYGPDNFAWVYPQYQTFKAAAINGQSWRTDNAHNWLLQIGVTLGLPATIIFISIFFLVFYNSLQTINKSDNFEIKLLISAVDLSLAVYFIAYRGKYIWQ